MRISHVVAAALLGLTALSAGEAAAFSMQNQGAGGTAGSGPAASGGAATNYLDPGDKLMQEMLGGKADTTSKLGEGGSGDGQGGLFGPKSGFSMKLQQTGPSTETGANRYFSTDQNPWK